MKFFYNFKNKHGILSQKFAAGVTKLLPPDEIRRFDGVGDGWEEVLVRNVVHNVFHNVPITHPPPPLDGQISTVSSVC